MRAPLLGLGFVCCAAASASAGGLPAEFAEFAGAGAGTGASTGLVTGAAPALAEEVPNRHWLAHVALVGPLDEVRLSVEPMGETRVHAQLLAGERRSLVVPLPIWGATEDLLPQIEVLGSGEASFVGWASENDLAAHAWSDLPRGLRHRPRPAPPAPLPAPLQTTALLAVAAALAAGWSLRARPARSLLVSLAAAACVIPLVAPRPPTSGVRVLEGDGASGGWVVVDAARGQIEAPRVPRSGPGSGTAAGQLPLRPLRVECLPPRTRLTFEVHLGPADATRWTLEGSEAHGCVLWVLSPLALAVDPPGELGAESNDLVALEEAWLRAADGSGWEALGAWPLGEALPAARGPEDPPGGLNPALPLGQRVLLGRLGPQAGGGGRARAGATWLRLVGL